MGRLLTRGGAERPDEPGVKIEQEMEGEAREPSGIKRLSLKKKAACIAI